MEELIKSAETYQLESLVDEFTRFFMESACNTAGTILRRSIVLARRELQSRNNPVFLGLQSESIAE